MSFISSWLRDDIKDISAYQVPDAQGMTKLDAMESPFPLPDNLISQYLAYLTNVELNRYPAPKALELQKTLRDLMGIPDHFGILLGNGSDELIQLLALACNTGDTVLSVEPSFVMYDIISKFTRINYKGVELDEKYEIDIETTLASINKYNPKIIFIAYPNNPTGNAFSREHIVNIIDTAKDSLVVLDEAYYAYAEDSFLQDINNFPNLVLLRTVSKIGFAGLRLGLLIGNKDTVEQLDKVRLPYNINTLTQVSANFLLQEKDEINKNATTIISERAYLSDNMNAIGELFVYPSQANFILFKAPKAEGLFEHLKDNGVLIKNLSKSNRLTNCLRVTVGTREQNKQFIDVVKNYYGRQ